MGLLTIILENPNSDKSTYTVKMPNGIPCLHNRISLVGWSIHKGGGNSKALKVRIPWLNSPSSLSLGKEGDTVDKSGSIVLPLDGTNGYESQQDIALHFDVTQEIIPTSFNVDTLNMDNTNNTTAVSQLILFFQYETRRLL